MKRETILSKIIEKYCILLYHAQDFSFANFSNIILGLCGKNYGEGKIYGTGTKLRYCYIYVVFDNINSRGTENDV